MAKDVFLWLPTGCNKSVVNLVTLLSDHRLRRVDFPVCKGHACVVVSPLLALKLPPDDGSFNFRVV